MTSSALRERSRRGLRRKLLLALVSLVGTLAALELGHRGWLAMRGRAHDAGALRERMLTLRNALSQRAPLPGGERRDARADVRGQVEVPHPYFGWETLARLDRVAAEAAYFRKPRALETFDVVVLGGSVAELVVELGGERLRQVLEADPRFGRGTVRVINQGRAANKQPQQVMALVYLLGLGYEPDAVVNLDGFNEVAVGNSNASRGVHPLYPMSSQWRSLTQGSRTDPRALDLLLEMRSAQKRAVALCDGALAAGLHRSSVLGGLALARMGAERRRAGGAFRAFTDWLGEQQDDVDVRGPPFPEAGAGFDPVADLLVPHWAASSRQLQALCSARELPNGRRIRYLHVLQPALHDEGSKPLTAEELDSAGADAAWIEGVRRGYPLLRRAGVELDAEGIAFHDASRVFAGVEESLYYDLCHFSRAGCELLAEEIARALLASL